MFLPSRFLNIYVNGFIIWVRFCLCTVKLILMIMGKKIEHLESASRFAEYKMKMNAYPIYKRTSKSEKVLIQTIKKSSNLV